MRRQFILIFMVFASVFSLTYAAAANTSYSFVKQWGEFGDKPNQFKFPTMITVDGSSNLYVVDQHNHRIQKFDSDGRYILSWGVFGEEPGQFNYPFGIAVDSNGDIYVSDMDNNRIQKFSSEGEFINMTGKYGTGNGQFKYPYGIAIDKNDILYVIDSFNYRIQKFDQNLIFLDAWGSEEEFDIKLYMIHEIAIDEDDNVLLSDRQNHRISKFTNDGRLIKRWGSYGEELSGDGSKFSEPHGITVGIDGSIFACDRYNFRFQKFSPNGAFQTMLYTRGAKDDTKHYVLGIAVDKQGNVYITDQSTNTILSGHRNVRIAAANQAFV